MTDLVGFTLMRMPIPDFFLAGAPKAGTTALHGALDAHPGLYLSPVKEPKHFLCDGAPPTRAGQRGPGDAHSAQEWVWRRDRYEALFAGAPPGAVAGESTPFYLASPAAKRRIADVAPEARFVVVVRDPVDRAYSNWVHLRADGLESQPDFVTACSLEDQRVADGWAPMWHYRGLGAYGRQLADLYEVVDRDRVKVLRYRDLVDDPEVTLAGICRFLGVEPLPLHPPAPENVKPHVPDTWGTRALGTAVRAGAAAGAHAPPQVWRAASVPFVAALHAQGGPKPKLTPEQRHAVRAPLVEDIHLLAELTGESYDDWLGDEGRGDFTSRRAVADRDDPDAAVTVG